MFRFSAMSTRNKFLLLAVGWLVWFVASGVVPSVFASCADPANATDPNFDYARDCNSDGTPRTATGAGGGVEYGGAGGSGAAEGSLPGTTGVPTGTVSPDYGEGISPGGYRTRPGDTTEFYGEGAYGAGTGAGGIGTGRTGTGVGSGNTGGGQGGGTGVGSGNTGGGQGGVRIPGQNQAVSLVNPLKNIDSIPALLSAILNVFLVIITPIIIFFIILAGFNYVTAQGDPGKLQKAKDALLYAVIGAVIVLGATAITQILSNLVRAFMS